MSLVTPVRRRQPVLVAAVLDDGAKAEPGWHPMSPTCHDGIRAAATREVPWRSHG
jgi:hypothetical protein